MFPESDLYFVLYFKLINDMKTAILLSAMIFAFGGAVAQDLPSAQVPSVVANALRVAYPKVAGLEWKRKNDLYHADFEIGNDDYDVWLDPTGKIIKRKYEIASTQLPASVQAMLKKEYAAYRIDDVEKIEDNGTSTYTVEIKKVNEEIDLVVSEDGKVLERKED